MIIFLNHRDRLFCDVFETPNNNNDYFTIIAIIGPTINRRDASLKSISQHNETSSAVTVNTSDTTNCTRDTHCTHVVLTM